MNFRHVVPLALLAFVGQTHATETVKLNRTDLQTGSPGYSKKGAAKAKAVQTLLSDGISGIVRSDSKLEFRPLSPHHELGSNAHVRYQQYYRGIPVMGREVIVHTDAKGKVHKLNGTISNNISIELPAELDKPVSVVAKGNMAQVGRETGGQKNTGLDGAEAIKGRKQSLVEQLDGVIPDSDEALNALIDMTLKEKGLSPDAVRLDDQYARLVIYIDEHDVATLAYNVGFYYRSNQGERGKPAYIVDAKSLKVLLKYDDMKYLSAQGTGPGGNEKVGEYEYGSNGMAFLEVTERADGKCTAENDRVRTMFAGFTKNPYVSTMPYDRPFTCPRNTYHSVNGAYSPMNDAHYFATKVVDMYKEWLGEPPVSFQVRMQVEIYTPSNPYQVFAEWDGHGAVLGNGYPGSVYPLVSIDIVSHEIAHGFSLEHSGYSSVLSSNVLTEAFSDIAGEAAEFYVRGSNDWLIGADVYHGPHAMRSLIYPDLDTKTLDVNHLADYDKGGPIQSDSGRFSHAFYLLATKDGWGVRKAFEVFADANRHYWISNSDFEQGVCGVINAADDRNYNIMDVAAVFSDVGLSCGNIPTKDTDGDGLPDLWEYRYGLDYNNSADAVLDGDNDGLTNLQEYSQQTLPNNSDSDGDTLSDGDEVNRYSTSPVNKDTDDDSVSDGEEVNTYGSNPLVTDTDGDGMPDGWEAPNQLNLLVNDASADPDGDGRSNLAEYQLGTSPISREVIDTEPNSDISQAQNLDGYFNLNYSPDIGDHFKNTSRTIPHVTVIGSAEDGDDYYKFQISKPTRVIFDIDHTYASYGNLNIYLSLFDDNGTIGYGSPERNLLYGQGGSTNEYDPYLEYTFNTPGTYFIQIYTLHPAQGARYLAHISLEVLDDDGDGLSNDWEQTYGLNRNDPNDAATDSDQDGLTNLEEYQLGTNPLVADVDGDGLNDGDEINLYSTDPSDADSDNDGLSDGDEVNPHHTDPLKSDSDGDGLSDSDELNSYGTDPLKSDSDGDGLSDAFELKYQFDPLSAGSDATGDGDNDGLNNLMEFTYQTNPLLADTDGDGLYDGEEVLVYHTLPRFSDTDGDGMDDKWEVRYSLDPIASSDASLDKDGDGWDNLTEFLYGTNPNESDLTPPVQQAYVGTENGDVYGIDLSTGIETRIYGNPYFEVGDTSGLAIAPDGVVFFHTQRRSSNPIERFYFPERWGAGPAIPLDRRVQGLTFDSDGLLYAVTGDGNFYQVDIDTGNLRLIGSGNVENLEAVAWDGTDFWAITVKGANNLYRIDKSSGAFTLVGHISGLNWTRGAGLSADDKGNLWGVDMSGHMFTIDKTTAKATIVYQLKGYYASLGIRPTVVPVDGDTDKDGMPNAWETRNGLDPNDGSDATKDLDGDGLNNLAEYRLGTSPKNADSDGDGINDSLDVFPLSAGEWLDNDGDRLGNTLDTDDDNDGVADVDDAFPFDSSEWVDTDGDGIGNNADTDDDNDGIPDVDDPYPLEDKALIDSDGDGIADEVDPDDDNDGVADVDDAFPLDSSEWVDTDGDGTGNNADPDDDNDGVVDGNDAFPLNSSEWLDTDGDGIGNNADTDDDNDGIPDTQDPYPLDGKEWLDSDGDGIGNNADPDDDNDGIIDTADSFPLDAGEYQDHDGDGIGDNADTDDDGDGVADGNDRFPLNAQEWLDNDNDGIGDNADTDDDNDGVADVDDAFPLDAAESKDSDGDRIGNNADTDDDNDGVEDAIDALPLDPSETLDNDGDGIGDNADTDDDNDGLSDTEEATLGTNPLVADSDGDGLSDFDEVRQYQTSPTNSDTDGDGLSDGFEVQYGFDPLKDQQNSEGDDDGDGLTNSEEMSLGTDPLKADTDEDGLNDYVEVRQYHTSATNSDTDGDELSDFAEVQTYGSDPLSADGDDDGMPDKWEVGHGLEPMRDDSGEDPDKDGRSNLLEMNDNTDPHIPEVVDVLGNDTLASAQSLDGAFNRLYSLNIGDRHVNTSAVLPHVTVLRQGEGDNGMDVFQFTVTQPNARLILDIDYDEHLGSHFDTFIELYDSEGRFVYSNDDAGFYRFGQGGSLSSTDSYLEMTVEQPGVYYIRVSSYIGLPVYSGSGYMLQVTVEGHEVPASP